MYTSLISTDELARQLSDPALVLVDCRHNLSDVDAGQRAYGASHLPGARFMHMDRDLSGERTGGNGRHPLPDVAALSGSLSRAGIDASKQVVAYDQNNGMWASRLWWLLHWLGHDAAAVLDGGIDKWIAEGRPITADRPSVQSARFVAMTPRPVISSADILRGLSNHSSNPLTIIDARAPERFRGDIEPLDPVAGHIPGAINRPYGANLTPQQTFKPAELLRAEFDAQLGGAPLSSVVHQCGSGVTACHNLLAMEVAGLPGSRLYPGSWSEWVADPARPVARGT
ncbi:MAG TPA: sulfurtransferase [Casimicrobiaceae bacterium]|jgi:thiosulfate/3-mercaptopyruvate sulfurtransferase|nr:sulfurtransferase [Casimicrobiaceae bacterium]